jgi:hypothetical protein
MFEKDNCASMVKSAAEECKRDITLSPGNQQQNDSGHSSASYGDGPNQSAANPAGSPGK